MSTESMPLDNLDTFIAAQYHPLAPEGRSTIVEAEMVRHQLRTFRKVNNLTQVEVAEQLAWSPSKLLRIENGEVGLKFADTNALLTHYGVDESVAKLIRQTVRANQRVRTPYASDLSQAHLRCLGYEAIATGVGIYAPLAIPDILQTSDFAQVLDNVFYPYRSSGENNIAAPLRKERAAYLLGKHGPPLQVIIDETALHRPDRRPHPSGEHEQYAQLRMIIRDLQALNTAHHQHRTNSELNPSISIKIQPSRVEAHLPAVPELNVLYTRGQQHAIVYAHNLFRQYTALNPILGEPAKQQLAFEELFGTPPGPEDTNDILDSLLASLPG